MFANFGISVDPDQLRIHVDDVLEAARRCGIHSEEKLALVLEMDKGQLHRQLHGDGHLSFTRLVAKMPSAFWAHLGWRLSCRFGLPVEAQRAAHLALALVGKRRQLKMREAILAQQKRSA